MKKINNLPSSHQVGDDVCLNFFGSGVINNCKVVGVNFSKDKITYDISILSIQEIGGDIEDIKSIYTIIKNVDSICVVKYSENNLSESKEIEDTNSSVKEKILSFVAVGDVIEVEYLGTNVIYQVDQFEVKPNSPHLRPIDFVIVVTLSDFNGGSITCTSDNFKYIRHIRHINSSTISGEEQPFEYPLDEKLPNFKFTQPVPDESVEEIKPYGYMLIKPEYKQEVFLIIGGDFLNSDGIHIRQPENIKKLLDAGVLNEWFVPILKYDEQKLIFGFPSDFMNIGITTDGYFIADTNNSADWRTIKFKLPKGKGNWVLFNQNIHNGNVTLHSLVEKENEELVQDSFGKTIKITDELIQDSMGKTIINSSNLRPYNRIDFLSSQEEVMDISQLDEELSKIVFKYAQSHMMKKDLELSIKIMVDVINNPQFYLVD